MGIWQRIKAVLSNTDGFMDLQSVMVGVLITAIIAGTATVGLIGFTRMTSDDTARQTLKTLNIGLESYYTDKDQYPPTLAALANGKYVPQSYAQMANTDICYVPASGQYPQSYTATAKSGSTGNYFTITGNDTEASATSTYPDTTTCK